MYGFRLEASPKMGSIACEAWGGMQLQIISISMKLPSQSMLCMVERRGCALSLQSLAEAFRDPVTTKNSSHYPSDLSKALLGIHTRSLQTPYATSLCNLNIMSTLAFLRRPGGFPGARRDPCVAWSRGNLRCIPQTATRTSKFGFRV